jgi:hypothetical protein
MGHLGNGTTVCNSAVDDEETRDFKMIAHINDAGVMTWYVKPHSVPDDARAVIERHAEQEHLRWLESWHKTPAIRQYERLLDWMNISELVAYHQWLRGIPKPKDISKIVETIISEKMCGNAHAVYGL